MTSAEAKYEAAAATRLEALERANEYAANGWASCPECHRKFDLTDDNDAAEWAYGHDCEEEE